MNKLITIILLLIISISNSRAQQANCNYLLITDIKYQLNELDLGVSGDSTHIIQIEMINTCKNCTEGPDYTELIVFYQGDTLAFSTINGIPRYRKKARVYTAFCFKQLANFPDPEHLIISLNHYCADILKELVNDRKK